MRKGVIAVAAHLALLLAPAVFVRGTVIVNGGTSFAFVIAALVVLSIGELRLSSTEMELPRLDRVLATISGVALLVIAWLALFDSQHNEVHPIGAVIIAAGIVLRLFAMRALGSARFRSQLAPVAVGRVVRTGIYRLRHPSEIGLVALGIGLAILRGSLSAGAVALAVLVPVSVVRLAAEERAMTKMPALARPQPSNFNELDSSNERHVDC